MTTGKKNFFQAFYKNNKFLIYKSFYNNKSETKGSRMKDHPHIQRKILKIGRFSMKTLQKPLFLVLI